MHMVQDGMSWLLASPEESLPFILADRGFDVWIANNRGTRWSRRHVSLDPSSRVLRNNKTSWLLRSGICYYYCSTGTHTSRLLLLQLYWNWSWDDLVVNDLPAMVDFVNTQTGQRPHYVGHSMVRPADPPLYFPYDFSLSSLSGLCLCFQGTLVALAAFSEGRVVDQLKSAALLTPVAYLAHITTPIGILLAKAFVGEVTYLLAYIYTLV